MANNLNSIEISNNKQFKIYHFGLIKFEKRMEYVAGGFSRVYFGYLAKKKVALKMLFAIELCPTDVKVNYYYYRYYYVRNIYIYYILF